MSEEYIDENQYSRDQSQIATSESYEMEQGEGEYPPVPREHRQEAAEIGIIRELDPKKNLMDIKNYILGLMWDDTKQKYVRFTDPLMNDTGIGYYLSILIPAISSLNTFSNYEEKEIGVLVDYVCGNAIPTIYINYKEYGIKDKCHLPIIENQLLVLTLAAFKKALNAGDRKVIGRTINEQIRNSPQGIVNPAGPEKKNMWQKLSPFG